MAATAAWLRHSGDSAPEVEDATLKRIALISSQVVGMFAAVCLTSRLLS
jgi:hypothetical protein